MVSAVTILMSVSLYYLVNADDCITAPKCSSTQGVPCVCQPTNGPPQCMLAPCEAGDTSDVDYGCLCTDTHKPTGCVIMRCMNSTASSPYQTYPAAPGYPTGPGYPTAPGYPTDPGYNSTPGYPPSSGYPSYSSYNGCGCVCGYQPPDCTSSSGDPIAGNPACSCTDDFHPTGCTLKPCPSADPDFACECSDAEKVLCISPQCNSYSYMSYSS